MAKYLRTFSCVDCGGDGKLEVLTNAVTLIQCALCESAEVWDNDISCDTIEYFYFRDMRVADC